MTRVLQRILFGMTAFLVVADFIWAFGGRFHIDGGAYLRLGLLALLLFAIGLYYDRKRDARIGTMLLGTSFLCAFSASASVLNYFLIPHTGMRIDFALAAIDRAMGVNWVALIGFAAAHPLFNDVLFIAYGLLLPQIALLIPILAWSRPGEEVYRFCLALGLGALITIGIWTLAPSFGAFSVYPLPAAFHKLPLALNGDYARALVALLKAGPGFITPRNIRGLIGFPSYHAVLALLVIRYAWPVRWLRWPAFTLNILVLVATPIQGGHHVIDVFAALPVTCFALGLVSALERAAGYLKVSTFPNMVNKERKFTIAKVQTGAFRADPAQSGAIISSAIKPTLSRLS